MSCGAACHDGVVHKWSRGWAGLREEAARMVSDWACSNSDFEKEVNTEKACLH